MKYWLLFPALFLVVSCSVMDPRARFGGFETEGTREVFETIHIRKPGVYDFEKVLHVWKGPGTMSQLEYQDPILHVHVSNVTIRNFAYRDSPEGIHIGALEFTPRNMRKHHSLVTDVRFENLQVLNIGEDAMTLQPNTGRIVVVDGVWQANRKAGSDAPGGDKVIQNDGGQDLVLIRPVFMDAARAIRSKSNTRTTVVDGRFIRTDFPLMVDGRANPRESNPFYLGQAGEALAFMKGGVAFRPRVLATAFENSAIYVSDVKQFGGKRKNTKGNGQVKEGKFLESGNQTR